MKIDTNYIADMFLKLVQVPSPVGYYSELNPVLEDIAREFSLTVQYDNKKTAFMKLEGENTDKTVAVCAHCDTLGLMVRSIDGDGMLKIRKLGGGCLANMENESVTVRTRDGRTYTGMLICRSHSVHVFPDTHTLERNEDTVRIILDENVHSKEEVEALGIQNGDIVFVDPHCEYTKTGYLKSRFIDDKGCMASCFAAIKYLKDNNLKPKYNVLFVFPYYEEVGMGATYLLEEVEEFLAVDIGLIGPDCAGNEHSVSICAKDAVGPYDYEFTSKLAEYAKQEGCKYAIDTYFSYGSDANSSIKAGNNMRIANIGPAVYSTHGRERAHIEGLENTAKLLAAYLLKG